MTLFASRDRLDARDDADREAGVEDPAAASISSGKLDRKGVGTRVPSCPGGQHHVPPAMRATDIRPPARFYHRRPRDPRTAQSYGAAETRAPRPAPFLHSWAAGHLVAACVLDPVERGIGLPEHLLP